MNNKGKQKIEGLILYYGLVDWWLSSFSEDERSYIDDRFKPMNMGPHTLTRGEFLKPIGETTDPASFLNSLATWFRAKSDSSIFNRIHKKIDDLGKKKPIDEPGYVDGRYFVTYVEDVKNLKKSGKFDEAEKLLLRLVIANEEVNRHERQGVAPWYYEELAKIYRKKKEYDKEVTILRRFANHKHARGVGPKKLLERLEKARALAEKARQE